MKAPRRLRQHLTLAVLLLLVPLVAVTGLSLGTVSLDLPAILTQAVGLSAEQLEPWQPYIFWQVRMPRVLTGLLVGGGLALAGAVMQGIFRNPMADPGVIGISGGAALGAVLAIATGLAQRWALGLPLLSFTVALGCAWLVYVVATVRGRTSLATLLLTGVAVGGMASALTSLVLSLTLPQVEVSRQIVFWLMGGLTNRTWTDVALSAPLILGGSLLLLAYSRDLDVLTSGEEAALALGVDVPRVRRQILALATAVTAAAVAVSGTLVFVGLVVPHILRLILGPAHRLLLAASFLGGAVLLVTADIAARTLWPPEELRLGVLTALLGGPFFLYLVIAHKLRVETL